jgi:hypothetical protein
MSEVMICAGYPPSANRYWRHANGRTYKSEEAEQYQRTERLEALASGVRRPLKGKVGIHLTLHPVAPKDYARKLAKGLEDSDRRRALGLTAIENGVMTADQQYAFTKAQGEAIKSGLERLRKSTADRPSSPQTTALLQKQLDRTIQAARIHAMRQIVSELR